MKLLSNDEVRRVLDFPLAVAAMERAFASLGRGAAAQQRRERTAMGDGKITTMAAILPDEGVSGAKVYTTIAGRFTFAVLLFDAASGALLACMEADELTRYRTAAATVVAARQLASPTASTLGVIGTGVQAFAHVEAMVGHFPVREVIVAGLQDQQAFAERITAQLGVPARAADARTVAACELVVLATRSPTPVIEADWLRPGAFVAAIGATLPHTREIGDDVLARCDTICVEWPAQALEEAGEFRLAAADLDIAGKLVSLDRLVLDGPRRPGAGGDETGATDARGAVSLYKAVGVALEDVALAAEVLRRVAAQPAAGVSGTTSDSPIA